MKRAIAYLLAIALCLFPVSVSVSAETVQPEISGVAAAGKPGETVTVEVAITENPGVAYLKLKVDYNADKLTLISAENTGLLPGRFVTSPNTSVRPYVLTWSSAANAVEDGVIVKLTFRIAEDAPMGDTQVSLTVAECYTDTLEDVTLATLPATVSVLCPHANIQQIPEEPATCTQIGYTAGEFCTDCGIYVSGHQPIPTLEHTAGEPVKENEGEDNSYDLAVYCTACGAEMSREHVDGYLPGDINGDGSVNNKDVTRLFQHLSNYDVAVVERALDTNGDGSVNNKDLTRLFQYLSNYDVEIH